ncbi:MAG: hypothetical protein PXY39_00385 [archaeon]|nr:hypothetical protein [archaeon]
MAIDRRFSIILLISIPLILLPFYDSSNLTTWIYFVTSFHNSQPTFYQSPWPGGFFALSVFIPLQLVYVATGFNIYASSLMIKAILFLFTFLTALILYDIVKRRGDQKKAELVFLFTMLNPAILYVNYIWAQIDIIPVFLVLLSYYLLRYEIISNNIHARTMVALLPLLVAVFFYLYPLILIPALIYYTSKAKQQFLIIAYALIYGVFFLTADVWAFRGSLYNYLAAGSGSVINNSYFSGLQFYVKLSSYEYIALLVFLSLILPLMVKRLSFAENSCLLIVLLLFLFSSTLPLADEFIWIYPFTVLALYEVNISLISLRKILLLNLFPFVGLVFINFFIGTGFQQGIWYFGYNVFHFNYLFQSSSEGQLAFAEWYNVSLLLALVFTFAMVTMIRHPQLKEAFGTEKIIQATSGRIKWKLLASYSVILLIVIFAALSYNGMNNAIGAKSTQNAPLGLLFPESPIYGYMMPVLDQTYWTTGNSVLFYASYYTTILTRTLENSNFNLTGIVSIYQNPPTNIGLINMNNLSASIVNEPYLTSNQSVAILPNSVNADLTNNFVGPRPSNQSIYYLNGNSSLLYELNGSSLPNHYFLFFFRPLVLARVQTVPFYMKSGDNVYEVALYPNYAIIAKENASSGTWVLSYTIPYSFSSESWNYLIFSSDYNSITMNFNGYNYSFNTINLQRPFDITVGVPPVRNSSNYALTGYVTGIISSVTPQSVANRYAILLSNYNDSQLNYVNSLRDLNYQVSVNYSQAMISIDNHSLSTDTRDQYIGIGKLTGDYYSISWLTDSVSLNYPGSGNYLLPAFFALITPYFVAFSILSYIYLERKSESNPKR